MSHAPPVITSLAIGAVVGLLAWLVASIIRGPAIHGGVIVLLAVLVAGLWYLRLARDAGGGVDNRR